MNSLIFTYWYVCVCVCIYIWLCNHNNFALWINLALSCSKYHMFLLPPSPIIMMWSPYKFRRLTQNWILISNFNWTFSDFYLLMCVCVCIWPCNRNNFALCINLALSCSKYHMFLLPTPPPQFFLFSIIISTLSLNYSHLKIFNFYFISYQFLFFSSLFDSRKKS